MATVEIDIWSDLHCPWAFIAAHRLREARDRRDLDVVLVPRAWPLEWVNGRGTPRDIVTTETAALASHEPDLFNAFSADSWPSTFLPGFELVAAARRAHGVRAAEDVDYAIRLAFFRDGVDVSVLAGLQQALELAQQSNPGIDSERIVDTWMNTAVRTDVAADYQLSKSLPIQGSPQVFWPDGSTTHNPGMTDHHWTNGLVRIGRTDPEEAGRLLAAHVNGPAAPSVG
jgi:predicted DsbA family dithiol-disulfide isomerase